VKRDSFVVGKIRSDEKIREWGADEAPRIVQCSDERIDHAARYGT
jgi:hypothetical protein